MSASEPHRTRAGNVAVDNAAGLARGKIELRQWVLSQVQPARVFDVFAGIDGEMHRGAWKDADAYVGCDARWDPAADDRSRYVSDFRRVLRSVDLQPWNVFDVDSYGMPWEAMLIIGARRRWAAGELGAVVCTDSALRAKFGYASHAQVAAVGLVDRKLGKTSREQHRSMTWLALARWARSSGVEIVACRHLAGRAAGADMQYFAAVFRGQARLRIAARHCT